MNRLVSATKETTALAVSTLLAETPACVSMGEIRGDTQGENAPSPTTPPRMATVFMPIWMAVKKSPGLS